MDNYEIIFMISSYRSVQLRLFRISINNRSAINNVIGEIYETEGS